MLGAFQISHVFSNMRSWKGHRIMIFTNSVPINVISLMSVDGKQLRDPLIILRVVFRIFGLAFSNRRLWKVIEFTLN